MSQCLICGCNGEDLIFKFYCSNPYCQNFHKNVSTKTISITDNIIKMLNKLWDRYGDAELETEDEFKINFFATGGRFSFGDDNEITEVIRPQWLIDRETWIY